MSFEDTLRQIIREEISHALKEHQSKTSNQVDGYPPVITVEEAADILKIAKTRVYELAHDPNFPAVRDGRKIRIPTQRFFDWIESNASNQSA